MKESEFMTLIRAADPQVADMEKMRYNLVRIVTQVAVDLFIKGDVTSNAAVAVREQMTRISNAEPFDFDAEYTTFAVEDRVSIKPNPTDTFPPHVGTVQEIRAKEPAVYVRYHKGYAKWEYSDQLRTVKDA